MTRALLMRLLQLRVVFLGAAAGAADGRDARDARDGRNGRDGCDSRDACDAAARADDVLADSPSLSPIVQSDLDGDLSPGVRRGKKADCESGAVISVSDISPLPNCHVLRLRLHHHLGAAVAAAAAPGARVTADPASHHYR